jgi:hypothetical protein
VAVAVVRATGTSRLRWESTSKLRGTGVGEEGSRNLSASDWVVGQVGESHAGKHQGDEGSEGLHDCVDVGKIVCL